MSDTDNSRLFQVEATDSQPVESLSDYISRHLQGKAQPDLTEVAVPEVAKNEGKLADFLTLELYRHQAEEHQSGMFLHHMDSQLANQHMERYIPTPSTRLHLTRERLDNELLEISQELSNYRRFDGPEYAEKITSLEARAQIIQEKIFELNNSLSRVNPFQSAYNSLQRWTSRRTAAAESKTESDSQASSWSIIPSGKPKPRNDVAEVQAELDAMHQILENQLHDPNFSSQQLGRLINQYDANLRRAEKLADHLRSHQTIAQKLRYWVETQAKAF